MSSNVGGQPPVSAVGMQTPPRKARRTANACVACRQSKIKCSGNEPCNSCQRRLIKCRFAEGGGKVIVSERYLQELRKQAENQQISPPQTSLSQTSPTTNESIIGALDSGPSHVEDMSVMGDIQQSEAPDIHLAGHSRNIWTSPFTLPSTIMKSTPRNDRRNWIWLAPWSMWSFTTRLTVMIAQKLQIQSPFDAPHFIPTELYPMEWKRCPIDEPPDITGLPSLDHALYLFNTVKFHLGQNYQFFYDDSFVDNIKQFYYGNAAEKAAESRLWFVEFLLVLAFGKGFLCTSRNHGDPPGSHFFIRAMSLMPDSATLWKDSLLAVEVLALISLYMYSIDHRESATIYFGQALVIAKFEGLHTQLPEDELGAETVGRCRSLWWTLYIMDRHFSSSVGLPMTTQDSDITTLLNAPGLCPLEETSTLIRLHVKLAQLLSHIYNAIYKTEKTSLGTFLETTRSILQVLAGHAQEIEKIIQHEFQNSVDTMPKGTRHITLLYHQCVIVATRPLLLSVLKERLEKLGQEEEEYEYEHFLALTTTVISTGIKSAVKTLQILAHEDSLLEVFLPFDLEFTYAAALHLTMANTLFPSVGDGQISSQEAHSILDIMIGKGNKIAGVRKAELAHLETLFMELALRIETQGLQPLTLAMPKPMEIPGEQMRGEEPHGSMSVADTETIDLSMTGDPRTPGAPAPMLSHVEFLDSIGISSDDFFTIVDQIANQDTLSYSLLDIGQCWTES